MRASVFVWFSFAHFQLQPVPERLQHPGCYQFEQDVWSELSSADIWFFFPQTYIPVPLLVVRSKPEHLIMSAWGVKQTQCQENCATHVHNRALEGCFFNFTDCGLYLKSAVREVRGVSRNLPAWCQWAKKKERKRNKINKCSCTSFPFWLQNSAWSDLAQQASLPSGTLQQLSPSVCADITLHLPENTSDNRNKHENM